MSINKVILIGNTCHDISVKTFEKGGKIAQVSVATNERAYKTKDGKEIPERAEFHNVVFRNALAEIAEKYVKKGDKIYIEGKLRTRSWDDPNGGNKRYITEIFVEELQMLGTKPKTAPGAGTPPIEETDGDLPFLI